MFALVLNGTILHPSDAGNELKGALSAFKEVGHALSAMKEGFSAMGGVVPSSQLYRFMVFNGAMQPVDVKIVKYKNIMGARIKSGTSSQMRLEPGAHSGNKFYEVHLYFSLEIPQANFSEGHHEMGIGNDPMVSLYHVYEDGKGTHAELVSSSTSPIGSNELSAMIYNGSPNPFPLSYIFTPTVLYSETLPSDADQVSSVSPVPISTALKGKEYKITTLLEPGAFHTLKSFDGFNLRPCELIGPKNKVVVPIKGFGIDGGPAVDDDGKSTGQTLIYPTRYNYEVLPDGRLVETGLSPGNFKQPVDEKIRNITPFEFVVWNPGVTDLKQTNTQEAFEPLMDTRARSMWVLYTGQVYSRQSEKMVDGVLTKIPSGKAISFYVMRPSCAKGKDMLYALYVTSSDDDAIKRLLAKFITIPVPVYRLPDSINSIDMFEVLTKPLNETVGLFGLDDASVQAYIIFQKTFSNFSYGNGPSYCTLKPPFYDKNAVITVFLQYLDATKSKDDLTTVLQAKIPEWVGMFVVDQGATRKQIEEFLLQYGVPEILMTRDGKTVLNANGNMGLFTLLYGPSSLSRMPLLYTTGIEESDQPTPWVNPADLILF